mmetsp:Transcript_12097/g.27601  ORF Transcript_12097/g.27601 Transcript_12097/m.27601 type:complete len:309 (-) Transcript_12097:308-1234(-)
MNLQLKSLSVLLFALEVASTSQRILRNEVTIVFDEDVEEKNATELVPTATTQLDEQRDLLSIESAKVDQEPCEEGFRETVGTEVTLPPTINARRPTIAPSVSPTLIPTDNPSDRPTDMPTLGPTLNDDTPDPTIAPSILPTGSPTFLPTISPTRRFEPTPGVGELPLTHRPTRRPTPKPDGGWNRPSWNSEPSWNKPSQPSWGSTHWGKAGKTKGGKAYGGDWKAKSGKSYGGHWHYGGKSGKTKGGRWGGHWRTTDQQGSNSSGLSKVSSLLEFSEAQSADSSAPIMSRYGVTLAMACSLLLAVNPI